MVDALCSGRSVRKDVLVRIQSWAPNDPCISLVIIDLQGFIISDSPLFTSFSPFLPLFLANKRRTDWRTLFLYLQALCPSGEIGRRTVFRSQRSQECAGSNPVPGTI